MELLLSVHHSLFLAKIISPTHSLYSLIHSLTHSPTRYYSTRTSELSIARLDGVLVTGNLSTLPLSIRHFLDTKITKCRPIINYNNPELFAPATSGVLTLTLMDLFCGKTNINQKMLKIFQHIV